MVQEMHMCSGSSKMYHASSCTYTIGATYVCMVLGYRWDACERGSVLATGVSPVSLWPVVTGSNLGMWSCLDVVEV
jgi:hypothetical protein